LRDVLESGQGNHSIFTIVPQAVPSIETPGHYIPYNESTGNTYVEHPEFGITHSLLSVSWQRTPDDFSPSVILESYFLKNFLSLYTEYYEPLKQFHFEDPDFASIIPSVSIDPAMAERETDIKFLCTKCCITRLDFFRHIAKCTQNKNNIAKCRKYRDRIANNNTHATAAVARVPRPRVAANIDFVADTVPRDRGAVPAATVAVTVIPKAADERALMVEAENEGSDVDHSDAEEADEGRYFLNMQIRAVIPDDTFQMESSRGRRINRKFDSYANL
jgi:hypothetical protein